MAKIHLIMPMGGNGSRFSVCGYHQPKPLIPIYGKPFFYWAAQSVLKFVEVIDITFVILKEHIAGYGLDKEILKYFPAAKIEVLDHVLNGPVLTCLEGIKHIDDDCCILFNDCDHLFKSEAFNRACENNEICSLDGALLTFKSDLPQYSYIRYENGRITGTVEKKVVSSDAICGAYLFQSASQFRRLAEAYFGNCEYKEYFISGMYNVMAQQHGVIRQYDTDYHIPFGIPQEYKEALKDEHYKELE